MSTTRHRVYFIDGPAQGRSTVLARTPWSLTWYHEERGSTHSYQRLAHVRGTRYYRHAR
jgi:hypothetical protein